MLIFKSFKELIHDRNQSSVNNCRTLDMTDHVQALVGLIKIKIAEMYEQQKKFKVCFPIDIGLASS